MRKYALLGLALMLCCFISGGVYIVTSISNVTDKLEKVISFHRVEFLRENLVHHIKVVQSDLLLQGSPHSGNIEISVEHVDAMEISTNICLTCHHADETKKLLAGLQKKVERYMKLISRTLTIRANQPRLENARIQAFSQGEKLLKEVSSLSLASADKISTRINKVRADIHAANYFLMACIILGPIAIFIITVLFLRRFTGSIDTLVEAAQALESGNLDYRIEGNLKDEFRTLANSFNGMAASLKGEQQKFEAVNSLYQTLFESAGDAIMITALEGDAIGRIVSANKAASELYGYSREELLGMNIVTLVPEGTGERFRERMKSVLNGEWFRRSVKRKRKDGSLIPVDLSLGPLELDNQRFLLTFCRDISDRLQAEEELQRANQMALVGQMAAGLAHEIKNPLAGVKVSLDVLVDELELEPEDREIFARIINEINRMEKLLKSLLNYARPPQPHFDLLDANRLLDSAIKNVEVTAGSAPGKRVLFEKDFETDLPQVEADSAQLQQVFMNIFLNAIDAMDNGGTIKAVTRMDGEEKIRVEISDTGKGLSATALEKIFTPFFTTKTKGTGLGLAICKRLIEQHDGTIKANSTPDQGTSFEITIPLIQKSRE